MLLAVYVAPALAADYEAGKQKAVLCAACHGEGGAKPVMPQTPILAGQYVRLPGARLARLTRTGTRQNPLMSPMAAPLTEEDIANLAGVLLATAGLWVRY